MNDTDVIDANAESMGIPKSSLMENAGSCIAKRIRKIKKPCKIAIYSGTGGNGGDGFVAARHLLNFKYEVEVFLIGHPSRIKSKESLKNWEVIKSINKNSNALTVHVVNDSSQLKNTDAEVVVDALLGTGIEGTIREPVSTAITVINDSYSTVLAVDIPTGLDPVTGLVFDKAVKADYTVTFHKAKTGLKKASDEYIGVLNICDIGIPGRVEEYTGVGDLLRLKKRKLTSHKGQNGTVIVVGGSKEYSGAPAFAALSALRAGVDISVVACPESVTSPIRSYSPDLIVQGLSNDYIQFDDTSKILKLSQTSDAMVIGCGIGREDETGLVLDEMLEKIQIPLVIDADALKIIDNNSIKNSKNEIVLTPHRAEFKAFFDNEIPDNLDGQIETVMDACQEYGCTILLKGKVDIISDGKNIKLNSTGNPGMTVGGTGDLLAGIVGGLIAQGHDAFESAYLGAYINGAAGDLAAEDYGDSFLASDILRYIPAVLKSRIR